MTFDLSLVVPPLEASRHPARGWHWRVFLLGWGVSPMFPVAHRFGRLMMGSYELANELIPALHKSCPWRTELGVFVMAE